MIELEKDDNIHVATMNNNENMISPEWQDRMLEILDIVESDCSAGAAMDSATEIQTWTSDCCCLSPTQ
ncbi:hypothetical protein EYC87_17610 [Halieaceae bacterium IMCC8485]|uniref:Uncharacterized protein n=1 Tax=Candidatus Seongchinamella marina TaxID=2518990 RepID=A0ABT3SZG5_9GAMM|nr:hypothetical protein [Candidatus Seongchinamella marina]MCX2975401.1 hypothetical protein [Candidatus Seongchinamella marina]